MTPSGSATPVHLLDGNVLVALVSAGHVHHEATQEWFARHRLPFATCPITQGTLLRLLIHLGGQSPQVAVEVLRQLVTHPLHHFWVCDLGHEGISWRGVTGHRQVTDAYLAALARHHRGKLVSLDRGLLALHSDVGVEVT